MVYSVIYTVAAKAVAVDNVSEVKYLKIAVETA